MLVQTYRRRLFDRALDRYGYITTDDARKLGIPPVELRKLMSRGGLERVGRGVYRMEDVPATHLDPYMEGVLLVGRGAYLVGETVLAFHDLASVNPRRLNIGTPRRIRHALPPSIGVVRQSVPPEYMTTYERIPSMTVARALRACVGVIPADRFSGAIDEAERRGLLGRADAGELRGLLKGDR